MHRVLHRFVLPYSFKAKGDYKLGSGFMAMHADDMHQICQLMATVVLQNPQEELFTMCVPNVTLTPVIVHGLREVMAAPFPEPDVADTEFPAHDGFIGGRKVFAAGRLPRKVKEESAAQVCRILTCYKIVDNHGFPPEWPGPIKEEGGEYVVNYQRLPNPIHMYSYLKQTHLSTLGLSMMKLDEPGAMFKPSARAGKAKGKVAVGANHPNTLIYMVRHLRTVDAAAKRASADEWALPVGPTGKCHLPLICTKHMESLKSNLGVPKKEYVFKIRNRDLAKLKLEESCGCASTALELDTKGISYYQGMGKYLRPNVELMLERIMQEEPEANLEPYPFEVFGGEGIERVDAPGNAEYEATKATLEREMHEAHAKLTEAQAEFSRCFQTLQAFIKRK